jgi:hypothetical protein
MIMTGANGGAGADDLPGWRWDVALSFAGAQRDYVGQVAGATQLAIEYVYRYASQYQVV